MTNVGQNSCMYHFDFTRNFFSSPDAEQTGRDRYDAKLDEFDHMRGKLAVSAEYLLQGVQLYETVLVEFIRHYTYHYLRYAVDTTNITSKAIYARLEAEFTQRTVFLKQELIHIDQDILDRLVEQKPELEAYRFMVESAQRYRPHTLSLEADFLLNSLEAISNNWEYGLYELLLMRTRFGTVKIQDGELDVLKQRAAISTHPDRDVRAKGFKKLYAGYASHRDLYAYTLISLVKQHNRMAQLHHFEDAPGEVYFNSYWSKAEVTHLLGELRLQAGVYLGYQRLRAEHARKKLGVEQVDVWDIPLSWPGKLPPHFTIEQATSIIREALS
jgi:oligoendopeptidase F